MLHFPPGTGEFLILSKYQANKENKLGLTSRAILQGSLACFLAKLLENIAETNNCVGDANQFPDTFTKKEGIS